MSRWRPRGVARDAVPKLIVEYINPNFSVLISIAHQIILVHTPVSCAFLLPLHVHRQHHTQRCPWTCGSTQPCSLCSSEPLRCMALIWIRNQLFTPSPLADAIISGLVRGSLCCHLPLRIWRTSSLSELGEDKGGGDAHTSRKCMWK